MKIAGNSTFQKISNCLLILNLLKSGPLSRIEIASILGLQPSSVTYGITRLMDEGVVTELASTVSQKKVGRKRNLVALNENCGRVVGMDLTADSCTMTVLSITGNVISNSRFLIYKEGDSVPCGKDAKTFIPFLEGLIEKAYRAVAPFPLLGICISVPGIVEDGRKGVKECWTLGMKDLDIEDYISSLDVPVVFENDANCSAMKYLWQSRRNANFFYLLARVQSAQNLPTVVPPLGIGLAVVVNGMLVRGSNGLAGEYRSSRLMGASSDLYRQSDISPADVLNLDSEPGVKRAFIKSLFCDVYCAMSIMDPDCIYVGGYLAREKERNQVYSVLNEELMDPFIRERLRDHVVVLDESSKYDQSEGAACLILDKIFEVPAIGTDDDFIWSRQLLKKII